MAVIRIIYSTHVVQVGGHGNTHVLRVVTL